MPKNKQWLILSKIYQLPVLIILLANKKAKRLQTVLQGVLLFLNCF
jgi:hypothetical protein